MHNFIRRIDRQLRVLPEWQRGYAAVLAIIVFAFAFCLVLLQTVGMSAKPVISLLGDLIFLGAAWIGYGPGLLSLVLITFIIPPILLPGRHHVDFGQFALFIIISLLVSTLSASRRKTEASLRATAGELEARVQAGSLELRRNEESRAWLAAMVESSDDAIIGKTLDGTINSWNAGAEQLYGYRRDEIVGRSVSILMPPESDGDLAPILRTLRNGEAIRQAQAVRVCKDGRRIVVSLSISPVRDAQGVIRGASTIARDRTAQRRAQEALEESEHRYRLLFENNPQPMWVYDREKLAFLAVNNTAVLSYGYTSEEFLAMTLKDIHPEEDIPKLLAATAAPSKEYELSQQWRHRKKNGQVINVEIGDHSIVFGDRPGGLVMATDVTERIKLEEQFRQAQRLESVGRLAGGVAHDFNNLLTVINGYTELLLSDSTADSRATEPLNQIREAGERAAALTQQLLAFSRKQVIQPVVIDINSVVRQTETLLRRLIGEDIELVTTLTSDLGLVRVDPGQLQQIVMNLAVNSRDAMPSGGTLQIETSNVMLDESYRDEHPSICPGPHVVLVVTDTGSGMSAEVRARIFEPFFTTKEIGKGTGLGLATVYGMVKQAGGWIWVYSEVGRGTAFKIYLPRTDEPPTPLTEPVKVDVHGTETIMIVEDQADVRALALTGLAAFGYVTYGASTGQEALVLCRQITEKIDLVVTDVVMPDMNGRQLAQHLAQIRPEARILFMSGYTADVIAHRGELDADVEYLQKPFTPHSLARKIRAVLAAKKGYAS